MPRNYNAMNIHTHTHIYIHMYIYIYNLYNHSVILEPFDSGPAVPRNFLEFKSLSLLPGIPLLQFSGIFPTSGYWTLSACPGPRRRALLDA